MKKILKLLWNTHGTNRNIFWEQQCQGYKITLDIRLKIRNVV
ncbi:MAG: hypothetical protein PVG86_06845 [Desulfobacterales bacterium]